MPDQLSNPGYAISSLLASAKSKFLIWKRTLIVSIANQDKPLGTQRVIALCLYCVSRSRALRNSFTPNYRPIIPTGTGGIMTREVDRRSDHVYDSGVGFSQGENLADGDPLANTQKKV